MNPAYLALLMVLSLVVAYISVSSLPIEPVYLDPPTQLECAFDYTIYPDRVEVRVTVYNSGNYINNVSVAISVSAYTFSLEMIYLSNETRSTLIPPGAQLVYVAVVEIPDSIYSIDKVEAVALSMEGAVEKCLG